MVTKTFVRVPIPISSSKAKAKGGVVATSSFGAATTNKSSPIAVDSVITNANDPIDKISQPQKQKHRSKASASRISEEENLPVISFKSIETETATNERAQSLCDHPSRTKRGVQHPGPGDVATAITAEGIFDIDRNLTHGHGKNHYCSNENKEGGKKRRLTPEESTRTRTSRIDDWFQQEYGLQIDLSDVPPQPPISKSSGRMKEGASKYTGVSFNKNKWQAQIMINGKFQHIGHYENEEEAAVDYARALFKYREREQRSFEVHLTDVPPQPPILRSAGHMKNGTSKYAGVSLVKRKNKYYKKRWIAKIMIKGNLAKIGAYDNEEEAAIDYARAVLKYKGKGQRMPGREREQMIPDQIEDNLRCIGDYEKAEEAAGDDACAVLKYDDEEALERERTCRKRKGLVDDLADVPPQTPITKRHVKEGASKYAGVYFDKVRNKWKSEISIDGKKYYVGYYKNEEDAAVDYARAVFKYKGQQVLDKTRRSNSSALLIDLSDVPPQPPIQRSVGHMKNGTSKYAGVSYGKLKKKWIAQIRIEEKQQYIGAYDNEEEAAIDYARAVLKHKGKGQGMPEREREQMIPEQIVDKSRCIGDYENEEEAAGDDVCAVLKCKDEEALHDREREQILVPMYERAAFPSPVAHCAAVTGAKLKPLEASTEVDFDIFCPPLEPVVPPGIVPLLEAKSLAGENDVLSGRGQLVNSHIGNQLFRELVNDFRPHYPKATDRLKRSIGRSIVLIVRHRGGRFLRTNDADGKLYELGDQKAQGKAMQALREGLDVRGTRAGANKKIKRTPHNAEESSERVTNQTMPAPVGVPPPWILSTYMPRTQSPPLPSRHHPYYYGQPPPPPPAAGYERGPTSSMPPYPSPNYQGYPPYPCPYPYHGYPPANNSYTPDLNSNRTSHTPQVTPWDKMIPMVVKSSQSDEEERSYYGGKGRFNMFG